MPSDQGSTAQPDKLDARVHADILATIIKRYLGAAQPSDAPRCYLLGGQPGAGKTGLRKAIEAAHEAAKPILIDPDELRIYHPRYVAFVEEDPLTAATRTHADAAQWADELRVEALARGLSVIVDGTLRSPDWAVEMARQAVGRGYAVEVHAVAVPLEVSRQGVRSRLEASFAAQHDPAMPPDERPLPRTVPDDVQVGAYDGLPNSLVALSRSGFVARIRVATRDGRALADLVGPETVAAAGRAEPNAVAGALRQERDRPWAAEEIDAYQERGRLILRQMQARLERSDGRSHDILAGEMEAVRRNMARVVVVQRQKARAAWVRRVLRMDVSRL